jgi:methylsterol monooxygenase
MKTVSMSEPEQNGTVVTFDNDKNKINHETTQTPKSITGPATMFPRLYPRPKPISAQKIFMNFLLTSTRGPFLCALIYHFLTYKYILQRVAFLLTGKFKSERLAFGVMLPLVHSITYSSTFAMFEVIERFQLFEQYRIGRTPGQESTWEMKKQAFWETARGWPGMFIGGQILYEAMQYCRAPKLLDPIQSIWTTTKHLSINLVILNCTFYGAHRLLHYGPIYQAIHKKHHEFVGCKSVAAQSLHPVESLVQTVPVFIGSLLIGTHPLLWLHLLGWRIYIGMEGHSGYSFRGSTLHKIGLTNSDDTAYHDCHHTTYGNFGALYLDWLFGTQDYWAQVGEEDGYLTLCKRREQESKLLYQS